MSNPTLLPCPFCAGNNVLLSKPHEGKPEHWCAICTPEENVPGCGASSPWCRSKDDAATKWNSRLFNEHQIRRLVQNENFMRTHVAMLKVGVDKGNPINVALQNVIASVLLIAVGIEIAE